MIPLSFAQRRLWFLQQMEESSAAYNIPLALRLCGELDAELLRSALGDVVARHESLRTVVAADGGEPAQVVLDAAEVHIPWEVRTVDETALYAALAEIGRRPFDLAGEIPLRAGLFVLGPREHALLIVMHHIATDGWSIGPLLRDLAEAYRARVHGDKPQWTELPAQYVDYTLWQRELLGDVDDAHSLAGRQVAYWSRQLADLPERLSLPTDRPRPAVASHQGGHVPMWLDAKRHGDLVRLARQNRTSVFMVLHAALATLFFRLGAGEDIPIGSPIAGRTDEALDDLVGFFVNTLVLRCDVSGDPSFTELLGRVRDAALGAYEHQDVPFEYLVEAMRPTRSLAHHPLFQVMLASQYVPDRAQYEFPWLDVSLLPVSTLTGTTKFDLSFGMWEQYDETGEPAGVSGLVEYASDLFDQSTVHSLVNRWETLLDAVVADPDCPITRFDVLLRGERDRLFGGWDRTTMPIPDATIPELVEAQVQRTPDATAVVCEGSTLSYAQLNERANQLAHALIAAGVGPERIIALALPRGSELVTAILGVLKAGAAYLPIDPDYPDERIEFILTDAQPTRLLTTTETTTRFAGIGSVDEWVIDGRDTALFEKHSQENPTNADRGVPLLPQLCAYVIYTSGSTGTPKAVATQHSGIPTQLAVQVELLNVSSESRVLQFASPSFDVSLWEMCMALFSGGTLLVPPADSLDPGAPLRDYIERQRVTHATLSPSALSALPSGSESSTALDTVVLAAEAPSRELIRRWARGRSIVNAYGATENTMCATMSEPLSETIETEPPVGRPIFNTRIYVLGPSLRPTPVGVTGELYIAGMGLARGYHARPGLTAERFVASPFGPPGSRMYRTGDLARWHSDGNLECLGRADDQIKVRGVRIEPREIETVLAEHPDVLRAAVLAREEHPGDQRLVAYVVPASDHVRGRALREYARVRLPKHMVPSAVVTVESFPLTPNGKLDWDALPPPTYAGDGEGVAARTPHEQVLAELFAEVLGVPTVGLEDNFFDLGGHSLLATQLADRIKTTLGCEMRVSTLFQTPTPSGLAGQLGVNDAGHAFDVILPLREQGGGVPLFCIHPAGGLSWPYSGLMRHLGANTPLYGVQARGLACSEELPKSLQQMAGEYADRLRGVQPDGPYCLLGWSFGGIVAHAVATELQRRGAEVGMVAVLDAYPDWHTRVDVPTPDQHTLLVRLLEMFECDSSEVGDENLTLGRTLDIIRAHGNSHALAGLEEGHIAAIAEILANNSAIMAEFTPSVLRGDVVLFVAAADETEDNPADRWRSYVDGEIETHPVDSTHDQMTRPTPLARVAAVLVEKLANMSSTVPAQEN